MTHAIGLTPKPARTVPIGLIAMAVVLAATSAATATPLTVEVSGQFGAGVTADAMAAPGEFWSLSFELDSNPVASNPDALGFDTPFSDFTYMLNGSAVAVAPATIRLYTAAGGGLLTMFFGPETGFQNGEPIPEFSFSGNQLFSGATTAPVVIAANYAITDALYLDSLDYDDEGASGNVTVRSVTTPVSTPEPTTFMPIFVALVVFRLFLRRKSEA